MRRHARAKFTLQCSHCANSINDFKFWFRSSQRCPACDSNRVDVIYHPSLPYIEDVLRNGEAPKLGMWRYYNLLPLNDAQNIITCGEGNVPIDRWSFLERFTREKYRLNCRIYAHRHDNSFATGTFKDLAGSLVASVLKENDIKSYVVATTGNIGVAYARYASDADITLYVFIPENSSKSQEAEVGCFGHKVFRVQGDYAYAKEVAQQFAGRFNILLAAGNFDPMRIEAKKTMVYEWLRVMPEFPTVYVQALSGGTGPLGIAKACKELNGTKLFHKMPRLLLVQSDACAPMADAWAAAKAQHFPERWEQSYPVYHNPQTRIPTLATGNPKTYPVLSKLVYESGGEIIKFPEQEAQLIARLIAHEAAVRVGPAAAVAVGGFLTSLKQGSIKDGDVVLLNIGEGMRRAPEFMQELARTTSNVKDVSECGLFDRDKYGEDLWKSIDGLA